MNTCTHCGRELAHTASPASICSECAVAPAPEMAKAEPKPRLTAPATLALVAINILVFLVMIAKGVPALHPSSDNLLRWGANFGPLSLQGQWWRLLTCMFLHIGAVHLLLNMWALWDLGALAEHLYGPRTFLAVYILSGLAGSIASLGRNPLVVSAGASGAIFGIAGALIATLYLGKLPAPAKSLRASLVSLLAFAGYNLAYGFIKGNIDNGAHVGGLVGGLLLGSVLSRDFHAGRPESHLRRALLPLFAALLVAATFVVRYQHMPVLRLTRAENLMAKGDAKGAIREFQDVTRVRPGLVPAWTLLGAAYMRTGQDTQAEVALQKALQIDPKNNIALAQLAMVYLKTQRYEPARAVLQRIVEANPRNADAHINLGVTLNQLGRTEEAVAELTKAVSLNPKAPLAWYNLGLCSMTLKRYDQAIAAFEQATRLVPNDPETWIWLANAYQGKGLSEQANQAYAKAYQLRARTQRRVPR